MLFNSLEFLVFLPIALALHFALPARFRWIFLLVASYYFYSSWRVAYVVLLLGSTLTDYICGFRIERSEDAIVKKRYLYVSLIVNLGLLFTFKYFDFINGTLRMFLHAMGVPYGVPDLSLTLPVGISFYTFQTLGYTIDVYKGRVPAEKSLLRFALYVSYFPQLVAGPIERARNLLPQLRANHAFAYARVRDGLALILWGLFKKVVIADRIAEYTNTVFADPDMFQGAQIWLADYFFLIQLYCDFSGYTDIALGTALVMGVRLMENFRQPLLARNIHDLWNRWHISLTTWFRDYLYPLTGGRRSRNRMYWGILVVFLVNGLWHGANWTFAAFGLLHGLSLVVYYYVRGSLPALYRITGLQRVPRIAAVLENILVLGVFVFGGNFFRATSLGDSLTLIRNAFRFQGTGPLNLFVYRGDFWLSLGFIVLLYATEWIGAKHGLGRWTAARSMPVKWALVGAGLAGVVFLGKWDAVDFIYFQF